jgi:Golgi apparatus protein 1
MLMRSFAIAMVLVFPVRAFAADHPCRADVERFCAGVQPGQGRIVECLQQHESDLSAACKEKRDSFRERTEEIRAACEGDAKKLCSDVRPGGGRIARCLQQHANELSDACRNEGEKMRTRGQARRGLMQDVQQACRDDAGKFCSNVKPGAGRIAQCLKTHGNQLSQPCTAAIQNAKDNW